MEKEFLKHLDVNCILQLEGKTKKGAIEEIINFATTRCTLDDSQLRELIWKREKMMTTGIGHGIAFPHIRVSGFPVPLVIFGLCRNPIPTTDYKSLDDEPIRLVVFVAADERDQKAYLNLLGSVSSALKEPGILDKLFASMNDSAKVLEILSAN